MLVEQKRNGVFKWNAFSETFEERTVSLFPAIATGTKRVLAEGTELSFSGCEQLLFST